MIYELREYEALPGRLPALIQRFDALVIPLWKKHGYKLIGFWTGLIGEGTNVKLHYILAWNGLDERQAILNSFLSDPEWINGRDKSEEGGQFVARVSSRILQPTSFSPLQ